MIDLTNRGSARIRSDVQAAGHYLELRTGTVTHLVRDSIGAIEARLDPERFVRIHRSIIVNVDRIRELKPASHGEFVVTLHSGARLRCTRTYADRLMRAMGS